MEQYTTHERFENDGTGVREVTAQVRIQSEAGLQRYGQLIFGYSSGTEKLEVNYVRVRKPSGQVIETPAANAQDFAPEVLESAPMYSDFRERHVTVSALRPGDLLEYQITTRILTPLAPGEFWTEYNFPERTAARQVKLEIDVPKERDLKLKSPKHKYTTAENGNRRTYTWVMENLAPDRKDNDDAEEEEAAADDDDSTPDVQLTTFKDWQEVAQWYARLQGERVVVDDTIRKKAEELTRGATTQLDKARKIYDFVARDIRYVSLSFGVGRYQPHSSTEVLQGSYGDCKDKHTLLAALLRAAGIQSYPVLIHHERKLDSDVPSPAQFDHVITMARVDKATIWLDATAEVAPFGLILYPLRDKQAVLAAPDATGGLVTTPEATSVKNTVNYNLQAKIADNGALDSSLELNASGDTAVVLRSLFRGIAEADWQRVAERFAALQGYRGKVSDVEVQALEQPARPFVLRYKVHMDSFFTVPSSAVSYFALPPVGLPPLGKKKPGTAPLRLGPAIEEHSKAHIEFAPNFTLRLPPEIRISRDYGDYSLVYRVTGNILDVDRTLNIRQSKLPPSRRNDYESLRSVATSYEQQSVTCDVRPTAKSAVAASSVPSSATPQEMKKAASKAMQQKDFKTAADLLRQVVDKQPDSSESWSELGKAYSKLGNHTDAIAAYRKQIQVNPFHKRVYDDLGSELERAGKLEDALAAYAKQIENIPTDAAARRNHALLLAQLGRDKSALTELEAVSSDSPDDPEIQITLARIYTASGSQDRAQTIFTRLIGSAAPAPNGDLFAAALREDINPDQTIADAQKILESIGDQFESGDLDQNSAEASTAMYLLALSWARIGWAKSLKGERLEALRYVDSAWNLSQSGTVANRLARLYEKGGDAARARQLLEWAVVAGGADLEDSKARLAHLNTGRKAASSAADLAQLRTVKIRATVVKPGKADFSLVFDGSGKPQSAEFQDGDPELLAAQQPLIESSFPVSFPDYSSVKIIRSASVTCASSGCVAMLKPLDAAAINAILEPRIAK